MDDTDLELIYEAIEEEDAEQDFAGSYMDYDGVEALHVEEDDGTWEPQDYAEAIAAFCGSVPFFGEAWVLRYRDQGLKIHPGSEALLDQIEGLCPGMPTDTFLFFESHKVSAHGFVSLGALRTLLQNFPDIDFSRIHVSLEAPPPTQTLAELPAGLRALEPADTVDLRGYCSPVADQGQSDRALAFAWTHAAELAACLLGLPTPRLSVNFTVAHLNRGDCQGLVKRGFCRQELWPEDNPGDLLAAMPRFRLWGAKAATLQLEDVKGLLTLGNPVVVTLKIGAALFEIGRDGVVKLQPESDAGWHSMLIVGYLGNHYICKNSWGTEWGASGYCYVPKNLLRHGEFQALLVPS